MITETVSANINKAARYENLTNGPMEGAHARVRAGRMRRPRKLKKRPELELIDPELDLELRLESILFKLAMSLLPKPMSMWTGPMRQAE